MKKTTIILMLVLSFVSCKKSTEVIEVEKEVYKQRSFSVNFGSSVIQAGEWVKLSWELDGFDSIEIIVDDEYSDEGMTIKNSNDKCIHNRDKSGSVYITAVRNTTFLVTVRTDSGLCKTQGKILTVK